MILVNVLAPVYPTEDLGKVATAVSKLFYGIEIQKKHVGEAVSGASSSGASSSGASSSGASSSPSFFLSGQGGLELLRSLHGLLRREAIIDSVRDKVFGNNVSSEGLSVSFLLNKQAAFVGVPSIPVEEEPLGSIGVIIRAGSSEELGRLIEWLLPLTEDGKPVVEVGMDYVEKE